MNNETKSEFVSHEFREVIVPNEMEGLWVDGFKTFDWALEKREAATVKAVWLPLRIMLSPLALLPGTPFAKMIVDHPSTTETKLAFKRDRKFKGDAQLARHQLHFETTANKIASLQREKTTAGAAFAFVIALLGTALMALSVFSMLKDNIALMIVFAVPAIIGWMLPIFIKRKMEASKSAALTPQIENLHDEISGICEGASKNAQFAVSIN